MQAWIAGAVVLRHARTMHGGNETQDDAHARSDGSNAPRPAPHLFLVLEADRPTIGGARYTLDGVKEVTFGRGEERAARREVIDDGIVLRLEVPAASMSRTHARLVRRNGHWQLEDDGSRNGCFVDGVRVERHSMPSGGSFDLGRAFFHLAPSLPTHAAVRDLDLAQKGMLPRAIASLVPELEVRAHALARVSRARVPLLFVGDTGSGKELAARAAHELSVMSGPFVAVQCGAIAPAMLEQALFGYEAGAFPGAVRSEPGFVRSAGGGTLFLDEVGDLSLAAQAAILRVLDTHEVIPVGSSRGVRVDLRLMASTHQSLEAAVARGTFRADLLARIAGYTHVLPPLRDRMVDFGSIVARSLSYVEGAPPVKLDVDAARALVAYGWPLNAREVRQYLLSAVALAEDEVIRVDHLPPALLGASSIPPSDEDRAGDATLRESLDTALREARGNVAEVARAFGKGPTQIHRWMKRLGINPAQYR